MFAPKRTALPPLFEFSLKRRIGLSELVGAALLLSDVPIMRHPAGASLLFGNVRPPSVAMGITVVGIYEDRGPISELTCML